MVFLSALNRRADSEEKAALIEEGLNRNFLVTDDDSLTQLRNGSGGTEGQERHEYWADDFAEIMLDYMTRLPEFYYYKAIN